MHQGVHNAALRPREPAFSKLAFDGPAQRLPNSAQMLIDFLSQQ